MINPRVKKLAVAGVLSAMVIVLGLTGLGFVPLPLGAVTILHVPVIIGAVLEGPLVGGGIGLLFGLFSLIQSALAGVTPLDVAFVNPLISVLPRLFIGPVAWLIYAAFRGRKKEKETGGLREFLGILFAALGGSMTNTVLVLGALALNGTLPWNVIAVVAVTNGPVEAAVAAVITLAIVQAWKRLPRFGGRARLSGTR